MPQGNLEMFLLGWNGDWPDATNFMDTHLGTGERSAGAVG
jgi:hypothetical protein